MQVRDATGREVYWGLSLPGMESKGYEMKAFEDMFDAVICDVGRLVVDAANIARLDSLAVDGACPPEVRPRSKRKTVTSACPANSVSAQPGISSCISEALHRLARRSTRTI